MHFLTRMILRGKEGCREHSAIGEGQQNTRLARGEERQNTKENKDNKISIMLKLSSLGQMNTKLRLHEYGLCLVVFSLGWTKVA